MITCSPSRIFCTRKEASAATASTAMMLPHATANVATLSMGRLPVCRHSASEVLVAATEHAMGRDRVLHWPASLANLPKHCARQEDSRGQHRKSTRCSPDLPAAPARGLLSASA